MNAHPAIAGDEFFPTLERQRETLREEVESDVAPLRGLSLDERGKVLESVCRDAMAILRARPDFERAVSWQDPRSDESMATWLALVKRYRNARQTAVNQP